LKRGSPKEKKNVKRGQKGKNRGGGDTGEARSRGNKLSFIPRKKSHRVAESTKKIGKKQGPRGIQEPETYTMSETCTIRRQKTNSFSDIGEGGGENLNIGEGKQIQVWK